MRQQHHQNLRMKSKILCCRYTWWQAQLARHASHAAAAAAGPLPKFRRKGGSSLLLPATPGREGSAQTRSGTCTHTQLEHADNSSTLHPRLCCD